MKKRRTAGTITIIAVIAVSCMGLDLFSGLSATPDQNPGGSLGASAFLGESGNPKPEFSVFARVLDENSVVVTSYDALGKALSEDNGITTVYIGADITAAANGIVINGNKESVVIDGRPPGESRNYTFTQAQSNQLEHVILVSDPNVKNVALRNITVEGKNFFGVVSATNEVRGLIVTHENVRYTGPQAVYNRRGTTRVIDSAYVLRPTGGTATNELAETLHTEMVGTVDIRASSSSNAVLWLIGADSTLIIRENARVSVATDNYFIYTNGYAPSVTMENNASLILSDRRGFTFETQSVSTFTMAEGASLHIEQHSPQSFAALRVSKLFQ
ncbi:MAG: hypothetical protein LBV27_08730, partial [Oscillospiraceae bacterium]|nr:hypothetical protein [Oscillospiraceae bacterium]